MYLSLVKTIRPHTLLPDLNDTANYMVYLMLTYEHNEYSYVYERNKNISFPEYTKCQSYTITRLCTNDSYHSYIIDYQYFYWVLECVVVVS